MVTKLVSTTEFANTHGVTKSYINQLIAEGVLSCVKEGRANKLDLVKASAQLRDFQEKDKKKQSGIDWSEEVKKEDARYKKAKADIMERELAELDGRLHNAEDVEDLFNAMIFDIKSAILAVPNKSGPRIAGQFGLDAAEISDMIRQDIYQALEELSKHEYDKEDYKKRARERKGWKEQEADDSED